MPIWVLLDDCLHLFVKFICICLSLFLSKISFICDCKSLLVELIKEDIKVLL